MEHPGVDADRSGVGRVEAEQQEIAAQNQQNGGHRCRDQQRLLDVTGGDPEHVAKENMGQVDVAAGLGDQHQSESKETGEDKTDHGVFLDP